MFYSFATLLVSDFCVCESGNIFFEVINTGFIDLNMSMILRVKLFFKICPHLLWKNKKQPVFKGLKWHLLWYDSI